jgi:Fuc2NAc and GlcNAc transferase
MLLWGLLLALVAGMIAVAVGERIRLHGARLALVQAPNARSSHTVPTPSGGGVGFVLGGTAAAGPLLLQQPWPMLPLIILGLAIAALGFIDDRRSLGVGLRLGAQGLICGAAVLVLAGSGDPLLSLLLVAAALVSVNVTNFMDGIDGIAATEAIFILLAAVLLAWGSNDALLWWMLGIVAALGGFLLLNWPPARLFMGDAGSTWLGLMLFVALTLLVQRGSLSVPQAMILPATFLADSLTTLVRRGLRGEPVWQAHRRHAYQVLARRWGSHRRVTLLFAAINIVLLLPLAALAGAAPTAGWLCAAGTYGVLVPLAIAAGAGRASE